MHCTIRLKTLLMGVVFSVFILAGIFINRSINAFFFRDPVAHFFDAGSFIWFASKGLISPLTASMGITLSLCVLPPILFWYITGVLLEHKKQGAALTLLLGGLFLWLVLFYYLGIPMQHTSH